VPTAPPSGSGRPRRPTASLAEWCHRNQPAQPGERLLKRRARRPWYGRLLRCLRSARSPREGGRRRCRWLVRTFPQDRRHTHLALRLTSVAVAACEAPAAARRIRRGDHQQCCAHPGVPLRLLLDVAESGSGRCRGEPCIPDKHLRGHPTPSRASRERRCLPTAQWPARDPCVSSIGRGERHATGVLFYTHDCRARLAACAAGAALPAPQASWSAELLASAASEFTPTPRYARSGRRVAGLFDRHGTQQRHSSPSHPLGRGA